LASQLQLLVILTEFSDPHLQLLATILSFAHLFVIGLQLLISFIDFLVRNLQLSISFFEDDNPFRTLGRPRLLQTRFNSRAVYLPEHLISRIIYFHYLIGLG